MALPLAVSAVPVGIQHRMNGGSKFTGVLPSTDGIVIQHGLNKYAPGTAGGLFYFYNSRPLTVLHYNIDFGASVSYQLALVSLFSGEQIPGERTLISEGTAKYLEGPGFVNLILGPHQALELTVSGSTTTPMIASVWAIDATALLVG